MTRRVLFGCPHLWKPVDNQIMALAVPAFFALIAAPLFVLADTAIIGHLGTVALAALGAAATCLTTIVGLSVFLAYGTTGTVARYVGAGRPLAACHTGIAGIWLAAVVGVVVAGLLAIFARPLLGTFLAPGQSCDLATSYVRISAAGIPATLISLAATGMLRGFSHASTPVIVTTCAAIANTALSFLLVYPAGLGMPGAAWGTVITETGMAVALCIASWRIARRHQAWMGPDCGRIMSVATRGLPLLTRTAALRVALVATTYAVARTGETNLAAHHVATTLWSFTAFALDALAIAAQTLVGQRLGASDRDGLRHLTWRLLHWGSAVAVVLAAFLWWAHEPLGTVFTTDPTVAERVGVLCGVMAAAQLVNAYVFVFDGVLIGAGEGAYLAWTSVVVTFCYATLLAGVAATVSDGLLGLVAIWLCFAFGFMGFRAVFVGWKGHRPYTFTIGADA